MANQKYDNLMVLMTTGKLNWEVDPIAAYLMQGVVFNASHKTMVEVGGSRLQEGQVTGRSVADDGSLLGHSVSFSNLPKDTDFQMLIGVDRGPSGDPLLIAFYDTDGKGAVLRLENSGTLIVRPEQTLPAEDTSLGTWVAT